MTVSRALLVAFGWLCAGLPAQLWAQVPQPASELLPRPNSAIYGGLSENNAGIAQSLEATLSVWGGNDRNSPPQTAFSDPSQSIGGPYSAGGAAVSYARRRRALAFGANASSQSRYYPELRDFLAGIHAAGVGLEASLGSKTRIQAQQSIAFTPLFSVNPFPVLGTPGLGESVPPNADFTIAQRDTRLLGTSAGFSRVLDGRSSFGAGYAFNSTSYTGVASDLRYHAAVVTWDRRLARNSVLTARYNFRDAQYVLGPLIAPVRTQEATLDLGQQWVHSGTRRSQVRISGGGVLLDSGNGRESRPVGGVQFSSLLGQSWNVTGSYQRGAELIAGLTNATYVDTVGVAVGGLFSPRVDASLSAGYATGKVGFDDLRRNSYTAATAVGRLGFAVHRKAALFGEVFYYSDSYPSPTDPGVGQDRERVGFRAGLSWWLPIIRERQSSGTR